jgi:Leucine-rich repeat (LRR) protein
LTSLPQLNEGLETLFCSFNQLTSLPELNENLKILFSSHNNLTCLPQLNENLEELKCAYNQLERVPPFNKNLIIFDCCNNQLTQMPKLNGALERLYCSNNQIHTIPWDDHSNLCELYYGQTPLFEILNNHGGLVDDRASYHDLLSIKRKIQVLNQFQYLYYSLRFKKKFVKWLWKIREPMIQQKYHPSYLMANLAAEDELEDFLENW